MWETLSNIQNQIWALFREHYVGMLYLALTFFSAIIILIKSPKGRRVLVIPTLLLVVAVFNPITYHFLAPKIVFWRMFWMIPEVIIMALAFVLLVKEVKSYPMKLVIALLLLLLVTTFGNNILKSGEYEESKNAYKLNDYSVQAAEMMLALDKTPKVVPCRTFLCDLRQYSGEIETAYGRDMLGYITYGKKEDYELYGELEAENPNYDYVFLNATKGKYDFVTTYTSLPVPQEVLDKYHFKSIGTVVNITIYYCEELNR